MRNSVYLACCLSFACMSIAQARVDAPISKQQKASGLLTAVTNKRIYGRDQDLRLRISLRNATAKRFHVRKSAGWGESSSISIWIVDAASGKTVTADFLPDEIDTPIVKDDELAAVEAGGEISWEFTVPLAEYPLKEGRTYKVWAFYHGKLMVPNTNGGAPTVGGQLKAETLSPPFMLR